MSRKLGRRKLIVCLPLLLAGMAGAVSAFQEAPARAGQPEARTPRAAKNVPRRPAEIENLVTDARFAPAEFAADVLLKLVESGKVADPKWKRELVEEAFRVAAGVQQPFRRRSLDALVDTRAGYQQYAFDLRMDGLSLRCRAVAAMLAIDKRGARRRFEEIPIRLALPRVECSERMIYDVSEFYTVLARVARETFTPEETKRGDHARFVELHAAATNSPAQVAPVAELILTVSKSPLDLELLTRALIEPLNHIAGDDRTYAATVFRTEQQLGSLVQQAQGALREDLLAAMRSYFVRHLRGTRCADNVRVKREINAISEGRAVKEFDYFNKLASETETRPKPVASITDEDYRPAKIENAPETASYWRTPAAKDLLRGIKHLRFGSGGKPLTTAEKQTTGWELELTKFLNDLADWDARAEDSAADYFHQKIVLLISLLEMVPPGGAAHEQVLRETVAFMCQPTMQQDSRIEWFHYVDRLLADNRASIIVEPTNLLDAFANSGDPVLRLYANLEKLRPPSPPHPSTKKEVR